MRIKLRPNDMLRGCICPGAPGTDDRCLNARRNGWARQRNSTIANLVCLAEREQFGSSGASPNLMCLNAAAGMMEQSRADPLLLAVIGNRDHQHTPPFG